MGEGRGSRRVSSFRDLVAWQKAMVLVTEVYAASAAWPESERFGLTNQVRRASVSIPANIAEGSGRSGTRELRHFLSLAHGSVCEVQTHLELAGRLGFLSPAAASTLDDHAEEVGRIIRGLIRTTDADETVPANRPTHSSRLLDSPTSRLDKGGAS